MVCTEKNPVPPIRGGAVQTYMQETAERLAHQHRITVLGVADADLPSNQDLQGVSYVRVPRGSGTLHDYTAAVVEYLKAHTFDLIHLFNRPRLVLPLRAVAPDARLILSLHNDMFEAAKIPPADAEQVIAEVEALVCVSNYVGQRVVTLYPEAQPKTHTIYSGVDLHRFTPRWTDRAEAASQSLRTQYRMGKEPVILFVGRLSRKKGADLLLQAMTRVAQQYPNAVLILVGSKWYGENKITDYVAYIRAMAERSPIRVISTGFVPPQQIEQWFWTGDLLVCSSQWQEPLARVHYEAMATGLPIVTTDRGGNAEVVQGLGNGIIVSEPEDPNSFADAILKLLANPQLREQMGQRGRALAEERFGWDRVTQEIRSLWEHAPVTVESFG